jgi:hypothetical protein
MDTTKQRRRDKRFLCADLVELVWRDNRGRAIRRIGNLENICAGGVCLQLEAPLERGTKIYMPCTRCTFHGIVRYVLDREDSYVIGVEFDKSNLWSRKLFDPQHLLDPDAALPPAHRLRSMSRGNWIN